ncbi:MAG: hypothetical protein FHK82_00215 [Sedimenticola thiotaurini]|uniref:Uncharacterized protein n=1 Tax=Sedimenticola thiotaurini TaxID=1543721 RepID=A0A558DGP5_9GAMM|nr:MAG: hypothetical protein FHK82_00215 [Sedimenticola thiotaurini]
MAGYYFEGIRKRDRHRARIQLPSDGEDYVICDKSTGERWESGRAFSRVAAVAGVSVGLWLELSRSQAA